VEVRFHHEARREFNEAIESPVEKLAMRRVLELLEQHGDQLGAPYSSQVVGAERLRELRPRGGRSPWRAFYRRIGAVLYVGAFGPEAQSNPHGFRRAVRLAEARLSRVEQGEER
jgi:hypothetical protein